MITDFSEELTDGKRSTGGPVMADRSTDGAVILLHLNMPQPTSPSRPRVAISEAAHIPLELSCVRCRVGERLSILKPSRWTVTAGTGRGISFQNVPPRRLAIMLLRSERKTNQREQRK